MNRNNFRVNPKFIILNNYSFFAIDYINNLYQIIAYIKFLLNSRNQHGVHSPFVYNFITKCLYDKTKHEAYTFINDYRETLKKSNTVLKIKDLGEGSKVLDTNERKVSEMVRTSSSSKKDTKILFRIANYFHSKTILELGTSLGMGTYAIALANQSSSISTIEGCPNTLEFAKSKLQNQKVKNVEFITGNFTDTIPDLKEDTFDFIFFDGHHNKDATIQYFETLLPKVNNDTIFIFDDIYWSKGMTEAWEHIKAQNAVSVTVDCFHLGFVFFRKEQVKEHFKIRL
ncbi:O-methyltransferase [Winogradskyella sp. UBA3174]|uniref:O-methyltransferase n=1 Tax=Winogradskyella sp. UBA3174 TaxID=1947785 RepID=UPI0025EEDC9E|nr:class I SAM-dependent methyltransferase [Winogradskyella sp. UBA3174]|tara:strand:- start:50745 stop:51599 length:855 start_codon:yes stop_codon:yes gene_type:complete